MAAAATPADVEPVPRDLHFDTRAATAGAWMGGDPVATAVFNALSLTFPDGEKLFVDAVRKFRGEAQGRLADEVRAFIAQESIHSREHAALNAGLDRARYPVERIEAKIRRRIAFVRSLGPMRMLGATIALEHLTALMADMVEADPALWERTPPELRRLWRWHAMEETEHKAVAYDLFNAVTRDWTDRRRHRYRVRVMLAVTTQFTINVTRYAAALLVADGAGRIAAHWRVFRFLFLDPGLFSRLGPRWRAWFRRDFHPWDHDNRATLARWRREFAGG
ncbi:MAG: metal-dependent hydrolase [Steroidobacteraceae bacterium]